MFFILILIVFIYPLSCGLVRFFKLKDFYQLREIYYKNIVTEENDIWSIGVISFILHHKYMPYSSKLYRRDIPYSKWPKIKYRGCSENAKDLWQNMLNVNMRHRYRIMDINNHPWMNDDKVIIK